ncbi:MAG: YfiR/HmsC family protein [bacterium]
MKSVLILIILLLLCMTDMSFAQKDAPPMVAASLTIKFMGLNKSLKGNIRIYVVGNDAILNELKKNVGNTIVSATITSVDGGSDVPNEKYEIIFCSSPGKLNAVKNYAKQNKSLSITNIPDLAINGITLGFGVDDDKKQLIFLNLPSSSEQGMEWNPAIMKVAQTIKN